MPPARFPSRCSVAVVGGGITGLSVASFLARRGVRDLVLFEKDRVGSGATGRSGGIALEGTAAGPPYDLPGCLEALEDLVETEALDCELERGTCWELVHGTGSRMLPWRDEGRPLSVAASVPCAVLDPGALADELARKLARREGVTILEKTPVGRLRRGAIPALETPRGVCEADRIVLALGAYTASLVPVGDSFRSVLTLAVCTDPLPDAALAELGLAEALAFYTLDLPYLWGRRTARGSLVVGGGLLGPLGEEIDLRRGNAARLLRKLTDRVRALHPTLSSVSVRWRWCGPVAFLPDRKPLLRTDPEDERIVVTGAYAGHGLALGVRVGQLVADHLVEGTPLPDWG